MFRVRLPYPNNYGQNSFRKKVSNFGRLQYGTNLNTVADPGYLSRIWLFSFWIPDLHKRFYVFKPKKLFPSFRKYAPDCSSRIQNMIFLLIPDPGVKKAPDPGSATPNLNIHSESMRGGKGVSPNISFLVNECTVHFIMSVQTPVRNSVKRAKIFT